MRPALIHPIQIGEGWACVVVERDKERFGRKLVRDAVIAIVGGVVIEPTLKALHLDDLIPYLPQIWFGIVWFIVLDALARNRRLRQWAPSFYRGLNWRRKVMSYLFVALFGAVVSIGFWWAITSVFRARNSTNNERATIADLRVTDWERLPIPLAVGRKVGVHLHVKNRNDAPIKAIAKYSPIWVDGNPEAMDYPARKAFEDDLWQKMLDAHKLTNDTPITIPGKMGDYWLPIGSADPLTQEQLEGLPVNKTLYFMGRIVDLDGKLLLEFCAHTGPDERTVLFCLDHNGLP